MGDACPIHDQCPGGSLQTAVDNHKDWLVRLSEAQTATEKLANNHYTEVSRDIAVIKGDVKTIKDTVEAKGAATEETSGIWKHPMFIALLTICISLVIALISVAVVVR